MKKCLSILLCLCMALTLLPISALAFDTGCGLTITGGTEGSDYTYDNSTNVLTITGNGAYTISGSSSADTIDVAPTNGGTVNITLSGVNIDARNAASHYAFSAESNVNLNLTLIGDNVLKSGDGAAGLEVAPAVTLNITAASTGTLTATGGSNGAGIGGDTYYNDCGAISILGGNVNAVAGSGAETIGRGSSGGSGTLTGVGGVALNRTPTVATLAGVAGGVTVSGLTIQNGDGSTYAYGSTTTTLADGKLYLWLPAGATVTGATVNGTQYSGSVASGQTGTLEFPTVASVTLSNGSLWNNYPDFASALQNAQNTPGSTLTLQDDVTYSSQINIGSTMTLDLNGHKLDMGSSCIQINSNADLTVNDGSGDHTGLITSSTLTLVALYGRLTVNSGTIETIATNSNALDCAGSNVVIHGGAFHAASGYAVSFSSGSLSIDGGNFTGQYSLLASPPGVALKGGTFTQVEALGGLTVNSLLADGFKYYAGSDTTGSAADDSVTVLRGPVTVGECDWSNAVTFDSDSQTYTVLSADGLRWISGVSNGTITAGTCQNDPAVPASADFSDCTIKLGVDVGLSGKNWTPIKNFQGIFDGAGHSVTGMTVQIAADTTTEYGGFFDVLHGQVRNLSVSGTVTISSTGTIYAGGIAGFVSDEGGYLYNCTTSAAVSATPTAGQPAYAGSLAGYNHGQIANCILTGTSSGALIGGVDQGDGTMTNCYTPTGTNLVGAVIDSPQYTSVGTYDAGGTLTATNGSTLAYGTILANAVKYWVGRQYEDAVNYVTWTADAIPTLTTTYAAASAESYGVWMRQTDGGYIRTDENTGITQTAEAAVTPSGGTETPCATLEDAITAAQSASGSTVKLLTDVTTGTEVDVTSGMFTIDLNGKTWSSTVTNSNALSLTGDADVTLMDSGTGGKFTSTAAGGSATVRVSSASAAFKSGTYASTGSYGCALQIYDVQNEGDQVTITGGTYQGEVGFYSCKNVSVSGGTFTDMQAQADNEGDLHTVGGLLADGYAYRSTESGNAWINSEPAGDLLNVSVQAAPVKITGQPQGATVTYGYTDAPTLNVTAVTVPADSGKTVSYQWYRVGTGADGADEAMTDTSAGANYTVESGLNANTYNYYCVVTCDGYTVKSDNAMVTVNKVDGAVANKTDGGYATSYTYSSNPIVSPAEANFTTNGGTGFTFTWYSGTSADDANKLLSAPTNAGTYTLKVDVAGTANVSAASVTLPVIISKANPGIGGITCSDTLYTSTVPSSVTLTRANITVPGMLALDGVTALTEGTNTYNWKFTPTDTSNYNTTAGTVSLAVTQDTLQSISASGTPNKTAYRYGDDFDMTGLTVTAAYLSGATKTVTTAVTASPLAVGDSSATLSYTDGEVTKTCTVSGITVTKKQLDLSGMSWSTGSFGFDGSAKSLALTGTLPDGVTVSKSGDSFIDAGD